MTGKKLFVLVNEKMNAGDHSITLDTTIHPLNAGTYVYQLSVENENGLFGQCKVLSVY